MLAPLLLELLVLPSVLVIIVSLPLGVVGRRSY